MVWGRCPSSIDDLPDAGDRENEEDQEQYEEEAREELRDREGCARDAGEPEQAGHETDDEENQCELKHGALLVCVVARSVPPPRTPEKRTGYRAGLALRAQAGRRRGKLERKGQTMSDAVFSRSLTGWQRAYVLLAAQYIREIVLKAPGDTKARAIYEALLEVLEPTRRMARQYRERRSASAAAGSMWDARSGYDRRVTDRRAPATFLPERERRQNERRSGRDRREPGS